MFRRYKNALKILSFLSLMLSTTFFILFIQTDATVGASFGPFTDDGSRYKFTFINHSSNKMSYDLTNATNGEHEIKGDVAPGKKVESQGFNPATLLLEQGKVTLIDVEGKPDPYFQFWSGNEQNVQYINVIPGNGYEVKTDSSEISRVTGNGLEVTVDGGGENDPNTDEIYVQVYDN